MSERKEIISSESKKKIEEVAGDISVATKMLVNASRNLRTSFTIETKHQALSEIRTNVHNRATLYSSKIMPFSALTVNDIKDFCEAIDSDYKNFKEDLDLIIKMAKISLDFCNFTVLFHEKILTEFKEIENKAFELVKQLELDYKYSEERNKRTASSTLVSGATSIMSPILGKEIKDDLKDSPEITRIHAMKHLGESINGYVDSLNKISGFFFLLLTDLSKIHDKVNDDDFDEMGKFYHRQITKQAKGITDACNGYQTEVVRCKTDIDCISGNHDRSYVNGWIQKVVEDNGKIIDFKSLLKKKSMIEIRCGITITAN